MTTGMQVYGGQHSGVSFSSATISYTKVILLLDFIKMADSFQFDRTSTKYFIEVYRENPYIWKGKCRIHGQT